MGWLARLSVLQPVLASVFVLVGVIVGLFAFPQLGSDRYPDFDLPIVTITTRLPGASPEEIESEVTEEIEKQVNTVSGIDALTSVSSEGVSVVRVQFDLDKNGDVGEQEVRSRLDLALPNLPREAERPVVQKLSTGAAPILSFTLTSSSASVRDLTEYADRQLRPQLESLSGVGSVEIVGGRKRQINVTVDPYRMRALNLTVQDVRDALRTQNAQVPGGVLESDDHTVSIRTRGRVQSIEELRNLAVVITGERVIPLREVAQVEDGSEEEKTAARVNGRPAVLIDVRKQMGANTVSVIGTLKARLKALGPSLPDGYRTEILRDQSRFIEASLHAIEEHLILGSILAALVVLVFLWDLRSTLISAVAIPTSIIATFGLMLWQGFTLNSITMLALTLSVGIVIDDAIIIVENIHRFLHEKHLSPSAAAIEGTREIGMAVLATTLSLVAVFLPIAFMSGIIGRFLSSFGVTMSSAILMSMLVAFTLAPMLAARWLRAPSLAPSEVAAQPLATTKASPEALPKSEIIPKGAPSAFPLSQMPFLLSRFFAQMEGAYERLLQKSLQRRWVVGILSGLTFLSIVPLGAIVNKNFLPDDDESQFVVTARAPEGTSLGATTRLLDALAREIAQLPEIRDTVVTVGDDPQETKNAGSIYVRLREVEERATSVDQFTLMERVRREVIPRYQERLRAQVSPPAALGGGGQAAIQFIMAGPDLPTLRRAADNIVTGLRQTEGVADADTSSVVGRPENGLIIDRAAADDLGVPAEALAQTARVVVAGEDVSKFAADERVYDVNLRALPQFREKESDLSLFLAPSNKPEVGAVPLSQVVRYAPANSSSSVEHYARTRQIGVNINLVSGASQQTVQDRLLQLARAQGLGPQYRFDFTGPAREMGRVFSSFGIALLLSFAFMYLVLAAQFGSWLHPVTILISLPLTFPFALASLVLTGGSLNIFSMLGILVLFGVVKKNSILQVDHTNQLRERGLGRDKALVQACRERLRPILMTTVAFVAGMIPLVLSTGTGAATNRAIGGVIVGGQTFALLLTLVATPVFYSLFDDLTHWHPLQRWRARMSRSMRSQPLFAGGRTAPPQLRVDSHPNEAGSQQGDAVLLVEAQTEGDTR